MNDLTVLDGIIIGAVGGGAGGIAVYFVQHIHTKYLDKRDSDRIYKWLLLKTENIEGKRFRSTRAISSWNNLPDDRVRYLCSLNPKIHLSTGPNEDLWSIFFE